MVRLDLDAASPGCPLHKPWQPMIGSERLSQLLCTDTTGGREIGTELLDALRRVAKEVGVTAVRAHAILHDDLGVYREVDGAPVYDREHGDISVLARRLGVGDWPAATQWDQLEAADSLRPEQLAGRFDDGMLVLEFELPQPGAALIEV